MRNIRRSKKFEEMVRLLADNPHPITKKQIFPTIRELMCFAATLGFQCDARTKLDEMTNDVDGRRFGEHSDTVDLMCLLSLAEEKSGEVLRDSREDDRVVIFEEYANGGFGIIQRWFNARPDDLTGDAAIVDGLLKDKFLTVPTNTEDAIPRVTF
jgi:dnd system-associated protein 4